MNFFFGYLISGIFLPYLAHFASRRINSLMEIDTRKMKFYTKFEIIEKRAFAVIYGKKPSNLEFRSIFKSILAHIFF